MTEDRIIGWKAESKTGVVAAGAAESVACWDSNIGSRWKCS